MSSQPVQKRGDTFSAASEMPLLVAFSLACLLLHTELQSLLNAYAARCVFYWKNLQDGKWSIYEKSRRIPGCDATDGHMHALEIAMLSQEEMAIII